MTRYYLGLTGEHNSPFYSTVSTTISPQYNITHEAVSLVLASVLPVPLYQAIHLQTIA